MGVAFPFWSEYLEDDSWKTRLHVMEVVSSVLLSGLAPTIYVAKSNYRFGRFPPLLSLPTRTVAFYTIVLPLSVILAIGTNLFVFCVYKIRKVAIFNRIVSMCVQSPRLVPLPHACMY